MTAIVQEKDTDVFTCVHCGHALGVLHMETVMQGPPDYTPTISYVDAYYHIPGIGFPGKGNICCVVKKQPVVPTEAAESADAYIRWANSLNLEEYYCMCKNPEPDLR